MPSIASPHKPRPGESTGRHRWTAAQALAEIDRWDDLAPGRRSYLKGSLKMLARAFRQPLECIPLEPKVIGPVLLSASPAALGLTPSTVARYRTALRAVLARLGIIADRGRQRPELAPAWRSLLNALPQAHSTIAMRGFLQFCSERGILPEQASDAVLAAYLDQLRTQRLTRDPLAQARRIATTWNGAVQQVAGWPPQALRCESQSRRYSKPLTQYPASLQAEVAAWRRDMAPPAAGGSEDGLYTDSGVRVIRRPRTVETRMRCLLLALTALVESGVPAEAITSLAVVVQPEHIKLINNWHFRRAGRKVTAHTGQIAETLRIIARHHVRLEPKAMAQITALTKVAKPPKQTQMSDRNQHRLQQIDDEDKLAMLLHLPRHLMKCATELLGAPEKLQPQRAYYAAWLAGVAVAIEIELRCPMRISELASLRLGHSLVRLDSRSRHWTHFRVSGEDTKNSEARNWPVHPETSALIEQYLRDFRPHLKHASTDWLFPSRDEASKPRKPGGLSVAISEAIFEHVGIEMHTHLFRAFAGAILLEDNPGALEDLRLILGNHSLDTAMRYYAYRERKRAAANLDKAVTRRRAETRLAASAAFGRLGRGKLGARGKAPVMGRPA